MNANKKTPEILTPGASVKLNINLDVFRDKGTKFNSSTQKVFNLFLSGGEYSVVELTKELDIPDPRSSIRYIRNEGINISDYWIKTRYSKYKVYFLK